MRLELVVSDAIERHYDETNNRRDEIEFLTGVVAYRVDGDVPPSSIRAEIVRQLPK